MSEVKLLLNDAVFFVPRLALLQVCTKFATKRLPRHYRVTSKVSAKCLEMFLSALKGQEIEVTKTNFTELSTLCDEFGFEPNSPSYRLSQVEVAIEDLRTEMKRLSNQVILVQEISEVVTQLSTETTQLRADLCTFRNQPLPTPISPTVSDFPQIFAEFRTKLFSLLRQDSYVKNLGRKERKKKGNWW
jgi:hypothetical protein